MDEYVHLPAKLFEGAFVLIPRDRIELLPRAMREEDRSEIELLRKVLSAAQNYLLTVGTFSDDEMIETLVALRDAVRKAEMMDIEKRAIDAEEGGE